MHARLTLSKYASPLPPSVHIYWPSHQISNVKIERWIKRFIGKLHWFKEFKVGSYLSALQLSLFPSMLVTQVGGKSPREAGRLVARARIRIRVVFWYFWYLRVVFFIMYFMHHFDSPCPSSSPACGPRRLSRLEALSALLSSDPHPFILSALRLKAITAMRLSFRLRRVKR